MIKEALQYLSGQQKRAEDSWVELEDGRRWDAKGNPVHNRVDCVGTSSLRSLVDFWNMKSLEWRKTKFVVINNPNDVVIVDHPSGPWRLYDVFFRSDTTLLDVCAFSFGQYTGPEDFIVGIQKNFLDTENRKLLLKVVGNISDETVAAAADDGVSQTVTTKVSAAFKGAATLPSPLVLQPYRTFLEVEQPSSEFVVRARRSEGQLPRIALHLADGGQWKLTAMKSIKDYLVEHLPKGTTVLA